MNRLPGELPDAGPAVDGLDHHDAAHELTDVDADHGDDRQEGVGERMPKDNPRAGEALGAGRPDIILKEHVDHRRAHHSRVPAGSEQTERQRRQNDMRRRAIAAHRKPAEMSGEHVEEQKRDDELRRRHADKGQHHHRPVDDAVAVQGGYDPEGQSERDLDKNAAGHQHEGRGNARRNQGPDLAALDVGSAEIAMNEFGEVAPELEDDGQVEPELVADAGDHLGVGAASGDQGGRIGREVMKQQECDDRDAEQHADRLQEPPGEQDRHQPRPRWVGSSRSRNASPTRLKESAVARMTAPGMNTSQGAA